MQLPTHIKEIMRKQECDEEDLLLKWHFQLKNCENYFQRKEILADYNNLVKNINSKDPYKHYRERI